jgi:hypothetical protein
MLSLLRAIAQTAAYRSNRSRLARSQPDDVWYDTSNAQWVVSYELRRVDGEAAEAILLFALSEAGENGRPEPRSAYEVTRHHDCSAHVEALVGFP